jgi:hypothetical protein
LADFYVDNDVAVKVADLLRGAGHAAASARDLHLENAGDDEQLLVASQHGRIFVTHNESDCVLLHDAWQHWTVAWGVADNHAGILIVPQGRKFDIQWEPTQIVEALEACLQRCPPLGGQLFRRKAAGWERRRDKEWLRCL